MRITRTLALAAPLLLLAACGGQKGPDPKTAKLLAELPAPYNTGDPVRGKSLFALCSACHTATPNGAVLTGPNLYGLFGTKAGDRPGFAASEPLKATGWTWDAATLDHWITDPPGAVPGTKMVFVGIKDAKQRQDLIAYLKVATTP